MIKRITNVDDFKAAYLSFKKFAPTLDFGHYGDTKWDVDRMYLAHNNANILVNSCVLVGSFLENGEVDALAWFVIGEDWRVGEKMASSYVWVSQSNKHGAQVMLEALRVLKRKGIKIINVGVLESSPKKREIHRFLEKLGFSPEDRSYCLVRN